MTQALEPAKFSVIVNGAAGGGHDAALVEAIQRSFRAAGGEASVQLLPAREMIAAVAAALDGGVNHVVVGGGDGSLSLVAGVLVERKATLGVLPLGTLNHFARDLGIPADLDAAVQVIVAGYAANVDVAEVNGRVFINNSSLGIYPHMVRLRERQRHRAGMPKWLALILASWSMLRRAATLKVRIVTANGEIQRRTPFAFVGNNPYRHAGLDLGTRGSLDGGVLGLYTARRSGRGGVFWLTLKALTGTLVEGVDHDEVIADQFTIDTRHHAVRVAHDGEIELMSTPLCYRSRPGALRVLLPRRDGAQEAG